jgi:hypothetical protein
MWSTVKHLGSDVMTKPVRSSPQQRVWVRDDLVLEDFGDEIVVLDPGTNDLHRLDPNATRLWRLVEELGCVTEIIDAIGRATGIDGDLLEADIRAALSDLTESGLLRSDNGF